MNRDEKVQKQAAYYVTRLFSGELTASEEREIQKWLNEDISHKREFNAILAIWQHSEVAYRSTKRASHLKRSFSFAASILITAITVYFLINALPYFSPASQEVKRNQLLTNKVHNPIIMTKAFQSSVGEVRQVDLPDGSTVTLNTDSEISVMLTSEQRLVELHRGEVFFDIQKENSRPFIINTGEQRITVLGTRFTVRKNTAEDSLKISVIEGVVEFDTLKTNTNKTIRLLTSGDIATYENKHKKISLTRANRNNQQPGWIKGVLRFDNAPLSEVIAELNRYRTKQIQMVFAQQEQFRISGVFRLSDDDSVLNAITATLPVKVHETEHAIELSKK
ncbi:DUF4974 domain-containing protein [Idiomarina sp. 29L]|uniref:FecR family protein n=1 Tax=Idiomarina sp. 29L TaxID=2508877 RepID=UPI0010105474|nr:FecR domain-containing protein [Idiomarina sp. 29L]RXS44536.1 DUF4974 domain-containing protein [Idiomarina sp. 29L]